MYVLLYHNIQCTYYCITIYSVRTTISQYTVHVLLYHNICHFKYQKVDYANNILSKNRHACLEFMASITVTRPLRKIVAKKARRRVHAVRFQENRNASVTRHSCRFRTPLPRNTISLAFDVSMNMRERTCTWQRGLDTQRTRCTRFQKSQWRRKICKEICIHEIPVVCEFESNQVQLATRSCARRQDRNLPCVLNRVQTAPAIFATKF